MGFDILNLNENVVFSQLYMLFYYFLIKFKFLTYFLVFETAVLIINFDNNRDLLHF